METRVSPEKTQGCFSDYSKRTSLKNDKWIFRFALGGVTPGYIMQESVAQHGKRGDWKTCWLMRSTDVPKMEMNYKDDAKAQT